MLDDLKVLYVAVPKAGWTSVLWVLAGLAGIPPERFAASDKPEVTLAMAVHDMSVWGLAGRRLAEFHGEDRERVLTEDGWFRFSVVRDPATRLWSAWQSKLLMREPRFVRQFGAEEWFPRVPGTPGQVLADFRRFVRAVHSLGDDPSIREVHWAPQHLLVESLELGHVGRVEQLGVTFAALRKHLRGRARVDADPRRENRMPLAYSPTVYDVRSAALARRLHATDCERYGYRPVDSRPTRSARDSWRREAAARLPLVTEMIARHQRLNALHRVLRQRELDHRTLDELAERVSRLEQRLDAPAPKPS